jgi:hypothetical protein
MTEFILLTAAVSVAMTVSAFKGLCAATAPALVRNRRR